MSSTVPAPDHQIPFSGIPVFNPDLSSHAGEAAWETNADPRCSGGIKVRAAPGPSLVLVLSATEVVVIPVVERSIPVGISVGVKAIPIPSLFEAFALQPLSLTLSLELNLTIAE